MGCFFLFIPPFLTFLIDSKVLNINHYLLLLTESKAFKFKPSALAAKHNLKKCSIIYSFLLNYYPLYLENWLVQQNL
jgi:hypothetical protein